MPRMQSIMQGSPPYKGGRKLLARLGHHLLPVQQHGFCKRRGGERCEEIHGHGYGGRAARRQLGTAGEDAASTPAPSCPLGQPCTLVIGAVPAELRKPPNPRLPPCVRTAGEGLLELGALLSLHMCCRAAADCLGPVGWWCRARRAD